MKNLRRQHPHDSLYMLLDTMCNAFGGIILLAVLVILLSSDVKQKHQETNNAAAREMQGRTLAAARENLQQSLELQATLQARTNSEQITLLAERETLRDDLDQLREEAKFKAGQLDAVSALDPAVRAKKLNEAAEAADLKQTELTNRLSENIKEIQRLKRELAELKRKADEKQNEMVRQLRLPKEHPTSSDAAHFLVQYGRIYPSANPDLVTDNDAMITFIPQGSDNAAAVPKPGKGYDLVQNASELRRYFARVSQAGHYYAAFEVAEDSFGTYNRVKRLVASTGLPYGWRPYAKADLPVIFTSNNSRANNPKPQ